MQVTLLNGALDALETVRPETGELNGVLGTGNKAAVIAGVVLSLIPPLLFYCFGQRYLIEGISIGGLK